jgi:hypothetical protein
MDKYSLYNAVGETADDFLIDAEQVIKNIGKHKFVRRKLQGAIITIAAVIAVLGTTVAAAASMGCNILDWISEAFINAGHENNADPAYIQNQLDNGQWAYLNGVNIAVIMPESPVKIMLSNDGGETWRESVVTGSEGMIAFGDWHEDIQYYGGYIGAYGNTGGYLILTAGVAMNSQPMRIYLTDDNGYTWTEIGNPSVVHSSVLTGAGFASESVGFISYRYYEDSGPDIWRTKDGGETWSKLEISLPAAYRAEKFRFTPQTPTFNGEEGAYPISVLDTDADGESTIYMYSHDGGLSWSFD